MWMMHVCCQTPMNACICIPVHTSSNPLGSVQACACLSLSCQTCVFYVLMDVRHACTIAGRVGRRGRGHPAGRLGRCKARGSQCAGRVRRAAGCTTRTEYSHSVQPNLRTQKFAHLSFTQVVVWCTVLQCTHTACCNPLVMHEMWFLTLHHLYAYIHLHRRLFSCYSDCIADACCCRQVVTEHTLSDSLLIHHVLAHFLTVIESQYYFPHDVQEAVRVHGAALW